MIDRVAFRWLVHRFDRWLFPSILFYFTGNQLIQAFGGTSVLIMIGVALDTMSKIESQLKMHNYDGFFK
ncbi:MAG: hypothetical protein ACLT98_02195 [Eggerthellaceae bacterium]